MALGARPEQGEGIVTGRRGQHGCSHPGGRAGGRGRGRRSRPTGRPSGSSTTSRSEPVAVKGKAEPLALWRARGGACSLRHRRDAPARDAAGRPRVGEAAADRDVRAGGAAALGAAGHDRRASRGWARAGWCAELFAYVEDAAGADPLAAGALPAVRGGDHVLGAGGDRQGGGGDPRVGLAGGGGGEAGRGGLPETIRSGLAAAAAAAAGRASRRRAGGAGGVVHGLAAFLEGLAADGPSVLVFEDLHWADAALLAFLEHLAEWAEGVPLLVLCTARPELYEQHPGWAARTARTRPRSTCRRSRRTETARLDRRACSSGPCCRRRRSRALLERAGGNPLYAEEFVRLLADRDARRAGG